ncbi:MAG TPA: peptide-methionine (R)-S-oxide reductase MsrB [Chthoniobacterales bacterium]|jgi:methionine-R-sulfoxide reductase|nr:peptide-methionine (R)-S-oxide reductase MsrB [Chthoniobacterales bacterium]
MSRIKHPSSTSSRLAIIAAVLAALLVAGGVVWWSRAQDKKVVAKTQPDEFTVPDERELRSRLSPEQYQVTRQDGTETAFRNLYWDNFKPGLYVDIITNEPLFSSLDKYDSGTGWPSFTKPISPEHIMEKVDNRYNMVRRQIRARKSNSHLGHIFDDGPPPAKLRYSVNSAALKFIPAEKLREEGFLEFIPLFEQAAPSPATSPAPATH